MAGRGEGEHTAAESPRAASLNSCMLSITIQQPPAGDISALPVHPTPAWTLAFSNPGQAPLAPLSAAAGCPRKDAIVLQRSSCDISKDTVKSKEHSVQREKYASSRGILVNKCCPRHCQPAANFA